MEGRHHGCKNDQVASLTIARTLPASANGWSEVAAHPELLFGHYSPDLEPGRSYRVISHAGSGSEGRIESVSEGTLVFRWGQPTWPEPARFVLTVGDEFSVEATGIPDDAVDGTRAHWDRVADGAVEYLASRNPESEAPPAVVLFDADGVLQQPREGWLDDFVRIGGRTFVVDAFTAELQCLGGAQDLRPLLQSLLDESDTGGTVDEVLEVWHDIVIDPDALALVTRARDAGLTVGLATNQQSYRGTHMRDILDFDRHFDHTYYSYEVGHAKPSAEYFGHIVAVLGVPADRVAFIDDAPANVTGARAAGLRAALHRTASGASGLAADLRSLGVPI